MPSMEDSIRLNAAEILCIGTELLLGQTLNTNARWISQELAILGIPHYKQVVVGDNTSRLKEAILEASKRCNYLITTGGLGPTNDDLTTETIARTFNTDLEENLIAIKDIRGKFTSQGIENMPASNQKQALFPKGAEIIPNPKGTAPGFIWSPIKNFTILSFPGVPSELKDMWAKTAKEWFQKNSFNENIFESRVIKFAGISESSLAADLEDLLEKENPTIAPYADIGEVKLRITAKAKNKKKADEMLNPLEEELIMRGKDHFYGKGDDNLASIVIELLRERGEKLVVAESCTGGAIGAALSNIPGASDVFIGGIIAYNNSIKKDILGVSQKSLEAYGAVSNEVVKEMARGAINLFNADWSIAVSGIAGPGGGSPSKPVGLVHFGIAGPKGCETMQANFGMHRGRLNIQKLCIVGGLNQLRLIMLTRS